MRACSGLLTQSLTIQSTGSGLTPPFSSATYVQCGNSALFDNEFAQPQIFHNIFYFCLF